MHFFIRSMLVHNYYFSKLKNTPFSKFVFFINIIEMSFYEKYVRNSSIYNHTRYRSARDLYYIFFKVIVQIVYKLTFSNVILDKEGGGLIGFLIPLLFFSRLFSSVLRYKKIIVSTEINL